jgi:glycosyltransferase involved in cell wall biosynthesis
MRIFFVTNNYIPYSGGVTQSIIAETDALRSQGHEVFIITLEFVDKKNEPQSDPAHVIRIPCPIKFMYKKNYMAIPWRPTHAIKKLLQQYKPDIVHVHHPFLLGVSALHAAQKVNIPCVFTYHTIYEDYAHYVPLPKYYTKKLIHALVKHFCNAVDGIIVPSSAIKEYLCAQRITKPMAVIPSPLRAAFLTQYKKNSPVNKKIFNLLVVSRFVPEKNIPFVFDIFKQLPENFNLTLVGYGNQFYAMQDLAFNTLKLSHDRVHFIHQPSQDELLNQYRNADLFIFSSQTDTQGIVLAESMSQGVPVIAIDGPGQRDIVINNYNGFIINNAQDAAQKIILIANDTTLHNALIAGAVATAQNYHADRIMQKLLTFYHKVCLDLKK